MLLTNGAVWQAHRLRFEKPITHDLVFTLDLLDADTKLADATEMLYLISKEAGNCSAIESYWKHKEATSRYVIAQVLLDPAVLALVWRQMRTFSKGLKVTVEDIENVVRNEVLKRDVLDGEKALAAGKIIRHAEHLQQNSKRATAVPTPAVEDATQCSP